MTTVTAKELRDNLDRIVRRARAGETIKVTYRSKPAFTITPEASDQTAAEPGSREAMQLFLRRIAEQKSPMKHKPSPLPPGKSYKEIYYEDMARKYGVDR